MSRRVGESHEKFPDWVREAGSKENLYVAYHWMPGSSEVIRTAVERELVEHYNPVCNNTFNPFFGLFGT